jgi:heme exporter protein D
MMNSRKGWLWMIRMYRALIWLAVVALIVGLPDALLQLMRLNQQSQAIGYGPSSGLIGSFPAWMLFFGLPAFGALVFALATGVSVLGMVVAWVNQRRSWLVVMLLVTLASILWPYAYQLWNIVHPSLTPPPTGGATGQSFTNELFYFFSVYAASLVPVVLVLVFSAFSRADMHTRPADNRLDADAALGITRSAL